MPQSIAPFGVRLWRLILVGDAVMTTVEMLVWGLIYIVGIFTAPYVVGALIYVFTLPVVIIVDLLDQLTDGTPPVETKPTLDA
jgi:hypothetical protein